MAEKSLFFNAFEDNESATGYDRNYNADDISDWLSVAFETGVIKTDVSGGVPQGLKVSAAGGLNINIATGKAAIRGKAYINTSIKTLTLETGASSERYDLIVLRYNNVQSTAETSRKISIEYVKGTNTIPTVANLQRDGNIYELMLAYVYIGANSNTIGTIYDMRGDNELCPWFTAVKGYEGYYDAMVQRHESNVTMATAGTNVTTDIASKLYNDKYSLIEVYTNGIKEPKTAYSVVLSGSYIVITFTASKSANTRITVELDNFIDGEGMSTALTQYTQLVADVANLNIANEFNYYCNGNNDNVLISQLAQAFATDTTLPANAQLTINVYGRVGITAAYSGDGSITNRYRYFDIGTNNQKRITVDFSHCDIVNVPLKGNTTNVIFNGNNVYLKNGRFIANCSSSGCLNYYFSAVTGDVKADNCYFESVVTGDVYLSYTGTFTNCEAYVSSNIGSAYCFYLNNNSSPCIVLGGKYRAYTGKSESGYNSAVLSMTAAGAACVLCGVNAPTTAISGFYQKNALLIYNGYITSTGLITTLPITTQTSATASIVGTIPLNK